MTNYTKTDRVFTMLLALCVLTLFVSHFKGCVKPEPVLVEQITPPQDTLSDWDIFYLALVNVESEGDPDAIGKANDAGIIQITPIYVREVNRILGEDRFTLECRFSPELSREMFEVIQSHYNANKSIKKAIKIHNPKAGDWYEKRIMKEMDKLKSDYAQLRTEMDSVNNDLLDFFD